MAYKFPWRKEQTAVLIHDTGFNPYGHVCGGHIRTSDGDFPGVFTALASLRFTRVCVGEVPGRVASIQTRSHPHSRFCRGRWMVVILPQR